MIHIFRTCPNLLHELENLPHATTGNVEDADPKAPDHAMDAGRYLLLNLGGGPKFPVLDEAKSGLLEANGIEVMEHAGLFGRRPSEVDALFEREEGAGTTRRSPFVSCRWPTPGRGPGGRSSRRRGRARWLQ